MPPADDDNAAELNLLERAALALGRFTNERPLPKRLQTAFLRNVSYGWVRPSLSKRLLVDGLRELVDLRPDRGILLVSNHRSFFDQYVLMLSIWMSRATWGSRLYFPVRSNFFYDHPAGMLVNYAVGAGAMYPPIYRQAARRELNDDALDRAVAFLQDPDVLVGLHPEGTRGKGDDPYTFLPAHPGVGKIALNARPIIVPGVHQRPVERHPRRHQAHAAAGRAPHTPGHHLDGPTARHLGSDGAEAPPDALQEGGGSLHAGDRSAGRAGEGAACGVYGRRDRG
jgi:1-acyl-sn-glycerol-3-phosphate acyltransferase